jgi:hypothetical protein
MLKGSSNLGGAMITSLLSYCHRAVRLLVVVSALITNVTFPSARADFDAPIRLSNSSGLFFTVGPEVGVDAGGNAVFVWPKQVRVEGRTLSAAGDLGPIFSVSKVGTQVRRPHVAVAPSGAALFVWERDVDAFTHLIEARTLSSSGILGPILILNETGSSGFWPAVALDAGGNAVFVWLGSGIMARKLSATGKLGPIITVAPDDGVPEVAADGDGDAVVVWRGGPGQIWARSLSAAGDLGPLLQLSSTVDNSGDPKVVINANGDALAVWSELKEKGGSFSIGRIKARTLSAAGALGPILTLSRKGPDAEDDPEVAVNAVGDAVLVWQESESGKDRVLARKLSASGVLGPIQMVFHSEGRTLSYPAVAIGAGGDAVVVWYSYKQRLRTEARTLSAGGTLGPVQTIWQGKLYSLGAPSVAVNPDGDHAVAIWAVGGPNPNVFAAQGP